MSKIKLFISYTTKDEKYALKTKESLENSLGDIISISLYEHSVDYRDDIKQFMDSIKEHDFVLSILSDQYLKSTGCIYEIGQIIHDKNFREKYLFITVPKTVKRNGFPQIYDDMGRLDYVKFWQDKFSEYRDARNKLLDDDTKDLHTEDINILRQIKTTYFPDFLNYLKYARSYGYNEMVNTNFEKIVRLIYPDDMKNFDHCDSLKELFECAIRDIQQITITDYNQIVLCSNLDNYSSVLLVVADMISAHKQHYRMVISNGLIAKSFHSNQIINVDNALGVDNYFRAVYETKSEIVVPIRYKDHVIGVINSESSEESHFSTKMELQLEQIASVFARRSISLGYEVGCQVDKLPYISIDIANFTK